LPVAVQVAITINRNEKPDNREGFGFNENVTPARRE
jgi:hypothetical protein